MWKFEYEKESHLYTVTTTPKAFIKLYFSLQVRLGKACIRLVATVWVEGTN